MPRIPYPELNEEQRKAFEVNPLNLARMMFHIPPKIRTEFMQLGGALLWDSDYDAKLRELIILRVGFLSNCVYELHQHRAYGKQMGLTDTQIEAAVAESIAPPLTEREQAVLNFTEQVVRNVRPCDSALAAARTHLSDSEIFETVMIIGHYMLAARIIETGGVDIDEAGVIISNPKNK